MKTRTHDLRCECRHKPLLATYGLDREGQLFVHVKVYKGQRIYCEIYLQGGIARLLCRECFRWHHITFRQTRVELTTARSPEDEILAG